MNKLLKVRNIMINMCMYNNRRKVFRLKIATEQSNTEEAKTNCIQQARKSS